MKKKNKTKAEFKKLIRQIARATQDPVHGEKFANLLSAMRGPDQSELYELKNATTTIIRNRLGWRCGSMADNGRDIAEVRKRVCDIFGSKLPMVANDTHFSFHISCAVEALKYFGFDKPRKK